MKAETKKLLLSKERGRAELIVFIAYIIGVIVIGFFHEPWFDESQAWSIARSASYKDMFFTVCHYEGHPPIWYLLLSPFAKLGAPFELSLKAVNLAICAAGVWLMLYKSPFPKIVRCMIPFSFFWFYQTAVICRPYSLVMLSLTLAAMGYKTRNEKPARYILPLMLLCGSHAYGIILAGGLCIVWVCEIFSSAAKEHKISGLIKDKRCHWLFGILVFALAMIACIMPADDIRYLNMNDGLSDKFKKIYMILVYPIDSLFGLYIDIDTIKQSTSGLIATVIGGALLIVLLIMIVKRNGKLAVFAVPYFLFIGFGHFKYLYWNHLGISTFFLMFTAWIILDSDTVSMPEIFGKISVKVESKLTKSLAKVLVAGIALMPLGWTVYCSVMDVLSPYGMREVAEFIKDNDMEGHTIMISWLFDYKEKNYEGFRNAENRINMTNEMSDASALSPYFDSNIFYNFNSDDPSETYSHFKKTTDEDNERHFDNWRQYGYPEYMIFKCPIDSIFPEVEYEDIEEMYDIIGMFERNCFYKFSTITEYVHVFKIKDEYRGKGVPQ